MCIVPTILLSMNIMKFSDVEEHLASRVALYWISLDAVYALIHFSQHKWFQNTHKEHHDMDIFPGYSFVYSPIDSICVQLCMQSPFYFGLQFSKPAWSISMFCLVFCGIMAHAQHHKRPQKTTRRPVQFYRVSRTCFKPIKIIHFFNFFLWYRLSSFDKA